MSDVKIPEVGLPEEGKQTSPIVEVAEAAPEGNARELCYFNGTAYSPGAQLCSSGRRLQCFSDGKWYSQGLC